MKFTRHRTQSRSRPSCGTVAAQHNDFVRSSKRILWSLSRPYLAIPLALLALVAMSLPTSIPASADHLSGKHLHFTITTAGLDGTLTLYNGTTLVDTWRAQSGNNNPTDQNVPNVGPIPAGDWTVRSLGSNSWRPDWFPIDKGSYSGARKGFYIHKFVSISLGCISIKGTGSESNDQAYQRFKNSMNGLPTIPLKVSYSTGGGSAPAPGDGPEALGGFPDDECTDECTESPCGPVPPSVGGVSEAPDAAPAATVSAERGTTLQVSLVLGFLTSLTALAWYLERRRADGRR